MIVQITLQLRNRNFNSDRSCKKCYFVSPWRCLCCLFWEMDSLNPIIMKRRSTRSSRLKSEIRKQVQQFNSRVTTHAGMPGPRTILESHKMSRVSDSFRAGQRNVLDYNSYKCYELFQLFSVQAQSALQSIIYLWKSTIMCFQFRFLTFDDI